MKTKIRNFINTIKININTINEKIRQAREIISSAGVRKNRFMLLFISLMFIFDYLVFCYHTERCPFNVFPSIPAIDGRIDINVYLPDLDGKTILKEKRMVSPSESRESMVRAIVQHIAKGSYFENTAAVVPIDAKIRKIWFHDGTCIIDLMLSSIKSNIDVIPGSEDAFKEAVEKTIRENIPSVKKVIVMERGIPSKQIWDYKKS